MLSLSGKRCFITGGSRGIGLAIAKLFASKGASCLLIGRNHENLETAPHDSRAFDVSVIGGWQALMAEGEKEPLDILVNAAGISQNSSFFQMTTPEIDQILDVNLKGTILGCRVVIRKMMRQKSGCIINISSILATHGGRGASVYAASKAGIIGLTRSLALEVGRFNIRTNVIQPGYIQTDMTKDKNGNLATLIPMGRLGLAEEVADAALFLANNSYAHNCVLNIDGGLSASN
ncbi:hypothetical protein F4824DRAFT_486635 [Ustulina deusta]|nr:hypothetical protein F4824DRAFT_486635 [Ustulina deusta]